MTILFELTSVMDVRDQTDNRLSQALVHFVTAPAHVFTYYKMYGLPIRAKYKHVKTIREHTFDKCLS